MAQGLGFRVLGFGFWGLGFRVRCWSPEACPTSTCARCVGLGFGV